MKATLTFDLDIEDDKMSHLRSIKGLSMVLALWDMDRYLREVYKYQENPDDIIKIRERFHEILENHGVYLDELVI